MFDKSKRVFGLMLDGVDEGVASVLMKKKTEVVLVVLSTAVISTFIHWEFKSSNIIVIPNDVIDPLVD